MSVIGNIENAIIQRLTEAELSGLPLFATVRGFSGGFRPALREAISRERMPAAYVSFLDDNLEPETPLYRLGPRFAIYLADRNLRQGGDPRNADALVTGVFELVDQVRAVLNLYAPATGRHLIPVQFRFVDADDRQAIYELTYRARPTESPIGPGDPPGDGGDPPTDS